MTTGLLVYHYPLIVIQVYSPGPVYFIKDEMTRFGKDGTAKYTQLSRRKELKAFKTPGPGRYENHSSHPQGNIHYKNKTNLIM